MIQIIELHKSFDGQQVLNGVNLEINRGDILVLIGRSGTGKSVFLKHLIGLIRPDHGKVLVDGLDVARLWRKSLDRLRDRFGVLFQGGALFDSLTVFENVAFPLQEKTKLKENIISQKVEKQLEQVGLSHMGHKYPAELSGGMRKRVALARALIMNPEILLFDEPTTGLDPIRVNAIHKLILDLHSKIGFTAVIVSHEVPEIFSIATRIAMLHQGIIVAHGTPEEIQSNTNPVVQQFIKGSVEGPIEPD